MSTTKVPNFSEFLKTCAFVQSELAGASGIYFDQQRGYWLTIGRDLHDTANWLNAYGVPNLLFKPDPATGLNRSKEADQIIRENLIIGVAEARYADVLSFTYDYDACLSMPAHVVGDDMAAMIYDMEGLYVLEWMPEHSYHTNHIRYMVFQSKESAIAKAESLVGVHQTV